MSIEVVVPEVSDGVKSGTVISVLVSVGDAVEEDQSLIEFETDKAVVAIPSPQAGVVKELKVEEGDTAAVGEVIAVLEAAESSVTLQAAKEPEPEPEPAQAQDVAAVSPAEKEAPAPEAPAVQAAALEPLPNSAPAVDLTSVRRDDVVAPAAPSVRRIARDLGVDIYQVQGSGPAGRISEEDVRLFVKRAMQELQGGKVNAVAAAEFRGLHAQRTLPDFSKWGTVTREPLSRVREVTADAMGYAWSTIPMVTQYDKACIDSLEAFRKAYNSGKSISVKLTMTAILAKVCAAALKAFPQFNSSLDLAAKELVLKDYINIGVAVDTPNGLLVPVIQDVAGKGIETIAADLATLAEKTRERKVSPAELEGGTFTISNLGGIGGTSFTPIVYAPQVAILGVSTSAVEPVWNGKEFEPKLMMPLSLTYDHRVIDGADGARFLRFICEGLEEPIKLMMK